jgi:hypothetical protein
MKYWNIGILAVVKIFPNIPSFINASADNRAPLGTSAQKAIEETDTTRTALC